MTTNAGMSPRVMGRALGVLYLLMMLTGSIPMMVGGVRNAGNDAATAANILTHPLLFQIAFASDLLVVAFYLPVTVLFYELLKPVNRVVSLTAAFFGLVGCAVQAFAALFRIVPLILLRDLHSPDALAYAVLKMYVPAYGIALVFFAFAMVLIGGLVFKSTFLPRVLGVLAMIAGLSWLTFIWPPLAPILFPRIVVPLGIGEFILALWLLIRGVDVERWKARARAA